MTKILNIDEIIDKIKQIGSKCNDESYYEDLETIDNIKKSLEIIAINNVFKNSNVVDKNGKQIKYFDKVKISEKFSDFDDSQYDESFYKNIKSAKIIDFDFDFLNGFQLVIEITFKKQNAIFQNGRAIHVSPLDIEII